MARSHVTYSLLGAFESANSVHWSLRCLILDIYIIVRVSTLFHMFAVHGQSSSQALVSWGPHLLKHFPCQIEVVSDIRDGCPHYSQHPFFLESQVV